MYLGDSNRQPQRSRENLEWYPRPTLRDRKIDREREVERERLKEREREGETKKEKLTNIKFRFE